MRNLDTTAQSASAMPAGALNRTRRGCARLVFNGDFHWFGADPEIFARAQRQVLAHTALRGNVETELTAEPVATDEDAGCGCACPDWIGGVWWSGPTASCAACARLRRPPSAPNWPHCR